MPCIGAVPPGARAVLGYKVDYGVQMVAVCVIKFVKRQLVMKCSCHQSLVPLPRMHELHRVTRMYFRCFTATEILGSIHRGVQ